MTQPSKIAAAATALTAALAALLLAALSCDPSPGDISLSAHISAITDTTTSSAKVAMRYSSDNVTIVRVGVVYGSTLGRLNIATIQRAIDNGTAPDMNYGVVSAPPSLSMSGRFDADLSGLADGTEYFVAPFVQIERSTGEFPDGYFLPAGYTRFRTVYLSGGAPSVKDMSVMDKTYTSARFEAWVAAVGDPEYIGKGFCYGRQSDDPMLGDGVSECEQFYGSEYQFSKEVSGLTSGERYYARAYIDNGKHTVQYGAVVSFVPGAGANSDVFTDARDGRVYKFVKAGRFKWMAENLDYDTVGASWCYDGVDLSCEKYGRLYTWDAARLVCPSGWHLPKATEWGDLIDSVGGVSSAGRMLKSASGWDGTDNFGFSALPGGQREVSGANARFSGVGSSGYWWAAAPNGTLYSLSMSSSVNAASKPSTGGNRSYGYSVRCVED